MIYEDFFFAPHDFILQRKYKIYTESKSNKTLFKVTAPQWKKKKSIYMNTLMPKNNQCHTLNDTVLYFEMP